ncbi:MAG: YihY/virulence factor BrkB family protein [Bacteroidota bacterium]
MPIRQQITKRILDSTPGKSVVSSSKKVYLPGFDGMSVFQVWSPFMRQLRKTNMVERASGISFSVVMAIPPTLLFIFTLVPFLPISTQLINELFSLIRDIVPGQKNNSVVIDFLNDFINNPRNGLLSFGLLLSIYFSSNAMMGILRAFDKNYPGFAKRKFWKKRLVAFQLTLTSFVLIALCLTLIIAQGAVLTWAGLEDSLWVTFIHYFRWVLVVLLSFYIVAFIYRHGPAVAKKWPMLTPGSVLATGMMVMATALVTWWVNNFSNYNKLYGSISAILILMSLIYVNALAVLVGFELNVTLSNLREEKHLVPIAT